MSPFSKDKPKIIQIYFMIDPPQGTATKFLDEMKRSTGRLGVGFGWGLFDGSI